jgi:hypothetical protein
MTSVQSDRFFKLACKGVVLGYYTSKEQAKIDRALKLDAVPELGHIDLLRGPDHWKGETHDVQT